MSEGTWMDILKVFGGNVRKYREALGLSQEAFAEKCGLHRTYISAVERQRRSISLGNVQKIADALEIEPHLLFVSGSCDEDAQEGPTTRQGRAKSGQNRS